MKKQSKKISLDLTRESLPINSVMMYMISLSDKAKRDNKVMEHLKVSEINHFIARTNRGELMLHLPYQGTSEDYWFILDSVRVDPEANKELIKSFNGILYTL